MGGATSINLDEYYTALGFPPGSSPDLNEVKKMYRKIVLKSHPDKGGSIDDFKKGQDAYDILVCKLEEQDEHFKDIFFDATLKKGENGRGFGLVFNLNEKNQVNLNVISI